MKIDPGGKWNFINSSCWTCWSNADSKEITIYFVKNMCWTKSLQNWFGLMQFFIGILRNNGI